MAEEKTFEEKVKKLLRLRGAWVLKTFSNGIQRAGVPDLIICHKGRFIGIELKAEKGRISKLQEYEIQAIIDSGGWAQVLRPSQLEEFLKEFDKI
jgi:Holliday junction resolvase